MQYPIIADIIVVAIILIIAFLKSKMGFFHSAMKLVILILAIAIGIVGSNILTPTVTEKVWPTVEEKITEKVNSEAGEVISGLLDSTQNLDGFWQIVVENLSKVGIDLDSLKSDPQGELKLEAAAESSDYLTQLKDNILLQAKVVVGKIVGVILGIAIFIVALILLKLIHRLIGNSVTKIPVLGWFDRLLGFIFGLIEAFVLIFILVRVAGLLHIDFFTTYAEGTTILNWFVYGNLAESLSAVNGIDLSEFSISSFDFSGIVNAIKELFSN